MLAAGTRERLVMPKKTADSEKALAQPKHCRDDVGSITGDVPSFNPNLIRQNLVYRCPL